MMKYPIKNSAIFIAIGLFIIAGSFILGRIIPLTDMVKGGLIGIGIGIMILSFIMKNKQKVQAH